MSAEFAPLGDQAVRVEFADPHGLPSVDVSRRVWAFCQALQEAGIPGVVEWIPAYVTVTVAYRPWEVPYDDLVAALTKLVRRPKAGKLPPAASIVVPTLYGGETGPDLDDVARWCGMTSHDVIRLHSSQTYFVHMIGFAPGFPYLGVLPKPLETPRRSEPRVRVPAGSVAIAGSQTGIYSLETPGGWNVIGRTPLPLYQFDREPASLMTAGDEVRFEPISQEEHDEIVRQVGEGTYEVRRKAKTN